MDHKYITIDCRNKIEVLHKQGYSAFRASSSSISRELKRTGDNYMKLRKPIIITLHVLKTEVER